MYLFIYNMYKYLDLAMLRKMNKGNRYRIDDVPVFSTRPMRAQGVPQGPGPQRPRGPTRALPKRAQGAHKGLAHKGPGGPQQPSP